MNQLERNIKAVQRVAAAAIDERMYLGREKHSPNSWRAESLRRHVLRAIKHAVTHLEIEAGDRPVDGENHLAAAVCRLTMALALRSEP